MVATTVQLQLPIKVQTVNKNVFTVKINLQTFAQLKDEYMKGRALSSKHLLAYIAHLIFEII